MSRDERVNRLQKRVDAAEQYFRSKNWAIGNGSSERGDVIMLLQ